MKNDFVDSVGRSDLKSRRGHSHNYFKAVEEELREEVEAVSPLDPKPGREKVVYQDKLGSSTRWSCTRGAGLSCPSPKNGSRF